MRNRKETGSAYVLALLALVVLGGMAAAFGWASLTQASQAAKKETRQILESMIQSGVQFAGWEVRYNKRALPFKDSFQLQGGVVDVQVDKSDSHGKNAVEAIVTAGYKGESLTQTRIISGLAVNRKPSEFAVFINGNAVIDKTDLTIIGDIHTNGGLTVKANSSISSEGAVTSSGGKSGNIKATLYEETGSESVDVEFPDIMDLRALATQTIFGGSNMPLGLILVDGEILNVRGSLKIQGQLKGKATVVVEGDLTIYGDLTYADKGSMFTFVVTGEVFLSENTRAVGIIMAQGAVTLGNGSELNPGSIALFGGSISSKGAATIVHDSRANFEVFRNTGRMAIIESKTVEDVLKAIVP